MKIFWHRLFYNQIWRNFLCENGSYLSAPKMGRIINYIQYHYSIFPSSEQNVELAN